MFGCLLWRSRNDKLRNTEICLLDIVVYTLVSYSIDISITSTKYNASGGILRDENDLHV